MSYLMKYTGNGAEKPLTANGRAVYWRNGETRWIEDEVYDQYEHHTDVFTKVQGPDIEDVLLESDDAKIYIRSSVQEVAFPGGIGRSYIHFGGAGEAEMTVTIGGIVYTEADTAVVTTGTWTNGASAADSAASLIAAINGDTRAAVPFTAVASEGADGLWIIYDSEGEVGNIAITTDSAANCVVEAKAAGGESGAMKKHFNTAHTVTTHDLTSGGIVIPLPFAPETVNISAYTAAGAPIYFTDVVEILEEPDRLAINTTGAVNLANTDIVHVYAVGDIPA